MCNDFWQKNITLRVLCVFAWDEFHTGTHRILAVLKFSRRRRRLSQTMFLSVNVIAQKRFAVQDGNQWNLFNLLIFNLSTRLYGLNCLLCRTKICEICWFLICQCDYTELNGSLCRTKICEISIICWFKIDKRRSKILCHSVCATFLLHKNIKFCALLRRLREKNMFLCQETISRANSVSFRAFCVQKKWLHISLYTLL